MRDVAVPKPLSDSAGQDTLSSSPVECGEDEGWKACLLPPVVKNAGVLVLSWLERWC